MRCSNFSGCLGWRRPLPADGIHRFRCPGSGGCDCLGSRIWRYRQNMVAVLRARRYRSLAAGLPARARNGHQDRSYRGSLEHRAVGAGHWCGRADGTRRVCRPERGHSLRDWKPTRLARIPLGHRARTGDCDCPRQNVGRRSLTGHASQLFSVRASSLPHSSFLLSSRMSLPNQS